MDRLTGTKGGAGVWQRIISEMPEHEVYIEPFWGRGTIAKRKRQSDYTIGIDLDPVAFSSGTISALMFLADGIRWLADYFRIDAILPDVPLDPATGISASPAAKESRSSSDAEIPVADQVAESCGTADRGSCTFGGVPWALHFVYLDPPYLGCSGYYRHELSEAEHRGLCRLFKRLPCPAALSGYRSDLYAAELSDCRSIVIPTVNRAGVRVDEILWMNYDEPLRYHDTRFIGRDHRERERIRRRVQNWSRGMARMEPTERQAVFEACAAVYYG